MRPHPLVLSRLNAPKSLVFYRAVQRASLGESMGLGETGEAPRAQSRLVLDGTRRGRFLTFSALVPSSSHPGTCPGMVVLAAEQCSSLLWTLGQHWLQLCRMVGTLNSWQIQTPDLGLIRVAAEDWSYCMCARQVSQQGTPHLVLYCCLLSMLGKPMAYFEVVTDHFSAQLILSS